jgi:hypothetical protein
VKPSEIEPATFQFVAQYLNHCSTEDGLTSTRNMLSKKPAICPILLVFYLHNKFISYIFSLITGIKTNMMLFVFLGPIATLTSVSGNCTIQAEPLKEFYFLEVGISVFTRFIGY